MQSMMDDGERETTTGSRSSWMELGQDLGIRKGYYYAYMQDLLA